MRQISPMQAVNLAKYAQVVVDIETAEPRNVLDAISAIWPNIDSAENPDGIISIVGYWNQWQRKTAFEMLIRKITLSEQKETGPEQKP